MTAALRNLNSRTEEEQRKRPGTPFADRLFRFNWLLLALAFAISGVGLYNLYVVGLAQDGGWETHAAGHLNRLLAGFVAFLIVSLMDVRFMRLMSIVGVLVAIGLLVYVHFNGEDYGTRAFRWIDLGPISLQPSEIAQIALVVFIAAYFDGRSYDSLGNPLWLIPPLILIGGIGYLILEQPDLGTTLKMLMLMGFMFFCAGVRWWLILVVIIVAGIGVYFLLQDPSLYLKPYQVSRMTCFRGIEMSQYYSAQELASFAFENPCDQVERARVAIGAAGIWGHGPLQAPQVFSKIIYEPENDLILAVHAEQFGLIGCLGLLILVGGIVYLGYVVSLFCQSHFTRLLALGAAINFGLYATINTMMVLSLLPVVGMPFALMSQGGTVTLFTWVGLGLINNAWINRHLVLTPNDGAPVRERRNTLGLS